MNHDEALKWLRLAIEVASEGVIAEKGGPFGAVVVKNGKVIAACSNTVTSTNDPTAHAEVNAIREACTKLNTYDLSDCEIYASCEPCPMCLGAIYWAHINKIVFAASRKDAEEAGFDDEFIYREIPLPTDMRSIPTFRYIHSESLKPFAVWKEKEDRLPY